MRGFRQSMLSNVIHFGDSIMAEIGEGWNRIWKTFKRINIMLPEVPLVPAPLIIVSLLVTIGHVMHFRMTCLSFRFDSLCVNTLRSTYDQCEISLCISTPSQSEKLLE